MKKTNLFLSILFVLVGAHHQLKTSQRLNREFMQAVTKNNQEKVISLLAQGVDVNYEDINGLTALFVTAIYGHWQMVKLLIDREAIVDHVDIYGETALFAAANSGHGQIVQILLAAGADVNHANDNGKTALIDAAINGHGQVVQILFAAGANVNHVDYLGRTALCFALMNVPVEVNTLVALLDAGARVGQKDVREFHKALDRLKRQSPLEVHALQAHMGLSIAKIDESFLATDFEENQKYLKELLDAKSEAQLDEQEAIESMSPEEREEIKRLTIAEQEEMERADLYNQAAVEVEKSWAQEFKKEFNLYTENKPNHLADFIFNTSKYSKKRNYAYQVLALLRRPWGMCQPLLDDLADTDVRKNMLQKIKLQIYQLELADFKREEEKRRKKIMNRWDMSLQNFDSFVAKAKR